MSNQNHTKECKIKYPATIHILTMSTNINYIASEREHFPYIHNVGQLSILMEMHLHHT